MRSLASCRNLPMEPKGRCNCAECIAGGRRVDRGCIGRVFGQTGWKADPCC